MTRSSLTTSQSNLLDRIIKRIETNQGSVKSTDEWLWLEIHVSQSAISNYLHELIDNKYLDKKADKSLWPTEKAIEFQKSRQNEEKRIKTWPTRPATVRIRGQVKAGRAAQEDLEIDLNDFDEPGSKSLIIPEFSDGNKGFALQVVGRSMEHEGIFEDDYVIVEEFNQYEFPQQNQLVVTYYTLFIENETNLSEYSDLLGPTLKYVRETQNQRGTKYYRLGWKKDAETSEYVIRAATIRPIGKVVGVYRAFLR